MKTVKLQFGLFLLACTWQVQAAQPTSGAYVDDPQSEYVQDQTSEGTAMASQILCYLAATRTDAAEVLNNGAYVAFVDESKCNSNKADASNSSSESSGSATEYTRMRMTSTRATATSAQIVKGHAAVSMGDPASPMNTHVYIHASATEAPSATAPNGVVTMNMTGKLAAAPGTVVLRGKIDAGADGLSFSMTQGGGGGLQTYQLYVDGDDTSGKGAMQTPNPAGGADLVFTFGYNSTTFCRKSGADPTVCFDRAKAQAQSSVWRYGVYDDNTGARYDIAVPGFPIKDTASNEYGYAGYWGIWFPSDVGNGAAVQSVDSAQTAYTVVKTGGRLSKVTMVSSTLDDIQNIPFNFMAMSNAGVEGGNSLVGGTQYEAYWDGTNFKIIGTMNCGGIGGCFKNQLDYTATKTQLKSATDPAGVMGWSMALGGQLSIPPTTLATGGTGTVKYRSEVVVQPGDPDVPGTLKCAKDCPTRNLIVGADAITSPFTSGTKNRFSQTAFADVVTYTWDGTNYQLKDSTGAALLNADIGDLPPENSWGIRTGALVDATADSDAWDAGKTMDCDGATGTGATFCDSNSVGLATYYVWENGTQRHQSATFLRKDSDNTVVAFTAPQSATFNVPADTKYGEFAGAKMNLMFGGFGNLWGIPGKCFDPLDNKEANCSETTRYVPAFSIPENTSSSELGKVTIGGVTKWVKYLDREIRFKLLGVDGQAGYTAPIGAADMGVAGNLPAAMVLTGDAEDPSNSANTDYYAGAITDADFKAAPAVIHGVVQ